MTEDELLARISSAELSRWWALYQVEAEERDELKHRREAGPDGQVFITGRDDEPDDEDDGI